MRKALYTLKEYAKHWRFPGHYFATDTPSGAATYWRLCQLFSPAEARARKRLVSGPDLIQPSLGFGIHDLSGNSVVMTAVNEARCLAATFDWATERKVAKKPFLIEKAIAPTGAFLDLALYLAGPVSRYLGSWPVLTRAAIWFSPNDHDAGGRSQWFHMDAEGKRQVKCFLPIDPVDVESGPFTFLPADVSQRIYRALRKEGRVTTRNTKLPDEVMERHFNPSDLVRATGAPGTVAMVDTCRCYHYGSRMAPKPRLLLHLHFGGPWARDMPLVGRALPNLQDVRLAHLLGPESR